MLIQTYNSDLRRIEMLETMLELMASIALIFIVGGIIYCLARWGERRARK